MAGLSLGGLASGLDTQSVVNQLMAIDRQPQTRLKLQQAALQGRQTTLTDVATRLRNLLTAAKDLQAAPTWAATQTLDVSDPAKVSATRIAGAAPGGHEIAVSGLARAEQRSFAFVPGTSGTLVVGSAPITVSASDTGESVADKINTATDSPVYAVYVKDPGGNAANDRLVLSRRATGEFSPGDMAVSGPEWTSTETYVAGANAKFTLDGAQLESRTNVVTNAIPGMQLVLKATGTSSIAIGAPAPDANAVKAKVQAFVDQYNSTVDFIRGKLNEKRVAAPKNDGDARKGALFADTQLTGLLAQLRGIVSDKTRIAGAVQSFGDLGVSTGKGTAGGSGADAVAGKLTLDAATFARAMETSRPDVKTFLTDPANGGPAKLTALLGPVAKTGGGLIDARARQAADQSGRIDDQIARIETRIAARSNRLNAQFNAMERSLAHSQSQGSWLAARLR